MSWFKKIFGFFQEEEDVDQKQIEPEKVTYMEQKKDHGKNVDAKVLYQYPKGKFRFPLIPDEEVKQQAEKRQTHKTAPEKKTDDTDRAYRKPPVQKESVKPERNAAAKMTRPFHPTEIPSPIYGFAKRPVKEQIEFELNSDAEINMDKKDITTHSDEQKVNEFEHQAQQEEHIESALTVIQSVKRNEEPAKVYYDEKNTADEETDLHILEEHRAEIEPVADVPISSEALSNTHSMLIDEKIDEPDEIEVKKQPFSEEFVLEEAAHKEKQENTEAPHLTESDHEEELLNEEPEQKPRSSRSHIPFNVIMLNKDRQKMKAAQSAVPFRGNTEPKIQEEKERISANQQEQKIVQNAVNAAPQTAQTIDNPSKPIMEQLDDAEELPYYAFPSKDVLLPGVAPEESSEWLFEQEELLNSTLSNFNVRAHVVNVTQGPSVTRFEVQPEPGVKVNKITNLSDDIKLSLAARDIRIEAPIPGKHTIGIEVPNHSSRPVFISEIINSAAFQEAKSPLTAVLGLDIAGNPIVTDLRKMPHGLIAGATGSGKSVCINTILISLLYKSTPDELKLLLIDPKMVELAPYNRIPHLVSPVITDVKAATAALKWAVEEMERRYELFAHTGVRDITRFNELAEQAKQYKDKLPYIVIVIDELADLMMMSPADVEEAICRIAQKARACGIHLIIATQRPSVDVITGLIKANVPTRVAFSVSSQVDSRTIIDISGAEKLLGRGDMLFLENGSSKPVRLQGTFVSDQEIDEVVAHVRKEREPDYLFEQEELLKKAEAVEEEDELFFDACEFIVAQGSASTSSLQRRFKIGYSRAARLIDMMEQLGYITENRGSKPRDVLISAADLESILEASTIN
ncbi:DNA translocase FtsK [Bacillus mesophilum]|uniref:DNA translocase FtsK n=1 Tax=Bacillus mesophilum TaxID=1071718 RepID=A0A7V7UWF7_9BACI|nr:DNA translocase FtsK [Bacillus mesophilum]KAB2334326.1 DNA translocase FtsK [Bacillus mesophilum]